LSICTPNGRAQTAPERVLQPYAAPVASQPDSIRAALRAPQGPIDLTRIDSSARPFVAHKKNGKPKKASKLRTDADALANMQERLWAESTAGGTRSLLLVLQGTDTSGKGGVTKHVVGACGPIGVEYTAFKRPTAEEQSHDFLWRIRKHVPAPGVIGVFDRSHYEDVLVVRVHDLVPREQWEGRYDVINAFEEELVAAGTTIVKCFLHISYDEQRARLLARLRKPDKHWKFEEGDLVERGFWPAYQEAYAAVLERCNTTLAPWYIVPSDSKKYRNWAVGELIRETLEELNPQYPHPELDLPVLRARLAPPH
jgi:PPK2 family polyphosphate:nucleotide phosphotransferase